MSITFRFSGGSDDIVTVTTETDSGGTTQEFNTYEKTDVMWQCRVYGPDPDDSVDVRALYTANGAWHFAAGPCDEEFPLPDWAIMIRQCPGTRYSAELIVVAPDGSEFADIWPVYKDAENDG